MDSEEDTRGVAAELNFPVAWGVERKVGDSIGAWWEEERDFIQPSEFFMDSEGKVLASTYSSSPIGRMEPEDGMALAKFLLGKMK